MKKIIALLLASLMIFALAACRGSETGNDTGNADDTGSPELTENYIITTSELTGSVLITTYLFDDDMKLISVSQKAEYTDTSLMTMEYSLVEAATQHFTDLEKDGDSFTCTMTEEGMESFYPSATYDSILQMAEEQELGIEKSK